MSDPVSKVPEFEGYVRKIAQLGSRLSLLAVGTGINLPNIDDKLKKEIKLEIASVVENPEVLRLLSTLARAGVVKPAQSTERR